MPVNPSHPDYFAIQASDVLTKPEAQEHARALFARNGCLLVRDLFPDGELAAMRLGIDQLLALRLKHLGIAAHGPSGDVGHFDSNLAALRKIGWTHVEVVLRACRGLAPVVGLGVHPRLFELSRLLMSSPLIFTNSPNGILMNVPGDDDHLFPWHQDYPFVQDSEDGVIYWIPLRDVSERDGALIIAPESHTLGVVPLIRPRKAPESESSPARFDLAKLGQFSHIAVPARAGDALAFSTLLLHRSGPNRGAAARWTLQVRHGNFRHAEAIRRSWPGTAAQIVPYAQSHPEYVTYTDSDDA